MNQHLLKAIAIALLYGIALMPQRAAAQCLCEGGVAPEEIIHTVYLDSVTLSTAIPIPQFPTATGTLTCVDLQSNITSIMGFDLINRVSSPFEYNMRSDLTASISGPGGLNVFTNSTENYGPFLLDPYMNGTDAVQYGPDTIFSSVSLQNTISSVAAYLGSGDVSLFFDLSGPVWAQPSSGNYGVDVKTYSNIEVTLTYYWCEATPLANNIKDFSAVLEDNLVRLQWIVHNDGPSYQYQIQTSYDGKSFQTVGSAGSKNFADGAATKYEYQLNAGPAPDGKLYYRIIQTNGNVLRYSAVRVVNLKGSVPTLKIYPNPTNANINLQFGEPVSGNFLVELSNQVGQVVHSQRLNLHHTGRLSLLLRETPPGGIYFLRAQEELTGRIFSGKLVVKRP